MPIHDTMSITADQYVYIKGVGFGTTLYLYRSARQKHPGRKTLEWLWYVKMDSKALIVAYSGDIQDPQEMQETMVGITEELCAKIANLESELESTRTERDNLKEELKDKDADKYFSTNW